MRSLHRLFIRAAAIAVAFLPLAGCGGSGPNPTLGQSGGQARAFGYVVADEPQAALAARQILDQGGNAVDAAAAAGFALGVTLPSRAGLGGGGACLIRAADAKGRLQPPVALMFPPGAPAASGGIRPAAVPALARGLLAMQVAYGNLPYASVIVPAERLAGGIPVSPALASDISVVGSALLADPAAAAVFSRPNGGVLQAGDTLAQPDLVSTLELLRTQGVQGFYQGSFPDQLAGAADQAGAALSASDIRGYLPHYAAPEVSVLRGYQVAALPSEGEAKAGPLPASTGFLTLDKTGGAVACALTMNNLFGTGRIAPGTGILLAVSPRAVSPPMLRAEIAYTPPHGPFRAAVTGTGQQAAAMAASRGMDAALNNLTIVPPDPGRANIISCPGGMPGGARSCTAAPDRRGKGLAVGP
jgi:gamma-glutamyltranspeptidase/glutathione hydrolase